MRAVAAAAPAKVNLFLRVLAREDSGYHQIESLFQALELHDRVEVALRDEPGIELRVESEDDLGPEERNLAVRAANAYLGAAGSGTRAHGVALHLVKRIPAGAGLGGGSSDAAAVLRAMDELHGGAVGRESLLEIGAGLGADVPFFLGPGPLALGWGRGERLLSLPPLPERPVVVVAPPFRIATAEAYGALDREGGGAGRRASPPPRMLELRDLGSWERVAAAARNDFEAAVFRRRPEGRALRDVLLELGASPALLSGSGSAVFGVFSDGAEADAAAERIRAERKGTTVLRTRTLVSWFSGPSDPSREPRRP